MSEAAYYERLTELGMASSRRSDLVVFLGRKQGTLIDNVKYAYLHAVSNSYGFEAVFVTRRTEELRMLKDLGLPVARMDDHGVSILTSAGVVVMDDLPSEIMDAYCLSLGAEKLQLWHGIPLKKIGFPEVESGVNMPKDKADYLSFAYSCSDVVLSTSPWVTETLFSKVFKAKEFVEFGYPRNDIFARAPGKLDMLNADIACYATLKKHKRNGGKVVVYMPTWRDTQQDFIDEQGQFVLDPQALSAFSAEHNVLFVLKLHPYVDDRRLAELPGVIRYASDQDIYPVLPLADALVTDYSAVYFDYLLLNKPIVFFAYDLARYLASDREMFFPYESMTPGPIATSQAAMLDHVRSILFEGGDAHECEREALREKLFTYSDADASKRICGYIQDVMLKRVARA